MQKKGLLIIIFVIIAATIILLWIANYQTQIIQPLCKKSAPFSLSWQETFASRIVQYYYFETDENIFVRVDYFYPDGINLQYRYLELFSKPLRVSEQYFFAQNGCFHGRVTDTNLYYNPFEILPCIPNSNFSFRAMNTEISPRTFLPLLECSNLPSLTYSELQKFVFNLHLPYDNNSAEEMVPIRSP